MGEVAEVTRAARSPTLPRNGGERLLTSVRAVISMGSDMLAGFFPKSPTTDEAPRHGEKIISRLRRGELPQMVDWFDPELLAKVGVRSVLSATIGSYTDQRLIQAATDQATEDELKTRYDYSGTGKPSERANSPMPRAPCGSTTSPISATALNRPSPWPTCWPKKN